MPTFAEIVNFKYGAPEVDRDIRYLLATGEFKPAYAETVRAFLLPEIANCKHTIDDETCRLNVHMQGPMCDDALTKTPEQINPILDRLKFSPKKELSGLIILCIRYTSGKRLRRSLFCKTAAKRKLSTHSDWQPTLFTASIPKFTS